MNQEVIKILDKALDKYGNEPHTKEELVRILFKAVKQSRELLINGEDK